MATQQSHSRTVRSFLDELTVIRCKFAKWDETVVNAVAVSNISISISGSQEHADEMATSEKR